METHTSPSTDTDPRVMASFNRLKAHEPERVRLRNWSPAAKAMVGNEVERDDGALLEEARLEVAGQDTFAASPEGRYVAAMHASIKLAGEISLAATAGLEAASRGWGANRQTGEALAVDVANSAQRIKDAACVAYIAAVP